MPQFKESLLDKIDFCKSQGYLIQIEFYNGLFSCNVLKDDKLKKEGSLTYKTITEAIQNAYSKLYDVLKRN